MSTRTPWTEPQKRGITTTGRNILVSAAAGSGKTAMLAARCVHLVCDAPDYCNVDELLVVTFTEAAAAEMHALLFLAFAPQRNGNVANAHRLGDARAPAGFELRAHRRLAAAGFARGQNALDARGG